MLTAGSSLSGQSHAFEDLILLLEVSSLFAAFVVSFRF